MKKYRYDAARTLLLSSGILFFTQLILENTVSERKPGFEFVLPLCFAFFACSLIYSMVLIYLNAKNSVRGGF
jgi:hypothetical protein